MKRILTNFKKALLVIAFLAVCAVVIPVAFIDSAIRTGVRLWRDIKIIIRDFVG